MKRMVIGLVLLVSLLAGGSLSALAMVRWHEPLEEKLTQAADFACSRDWEQAVQLRRQVQQLWERRWHMAAAFADHDPMEEIDSLFAQLQIYERYREPMAYSALCRELARELGAMGDAHIPNWWNLL